MDASPTTEAPAGARLVQREGALDDFDFVQATLLNHYYEESFWAQRLTTRAFFDGHTPLVRALLQQARVVVACLADDPSTILGFVVFEPGGGPDGRDVLDFLYVKKAFRDAGVGKMLLAATGYPPDLAGVAVTFCTKAWFRTKQQPHALEDRFDALYWPYGQWRAFHV